MAKTEVLTEANREEEFNAEVVNLDKYIKEVETTLVESETGRDLSTVKAQYTRHKVSAHEAQSNGCYCFICEIVTKIEKSARLARLESLHEKFQPA